MRKVSKKRSGWLKNYNKVLDAWRPDKCARCGGPGDGWSTRGGDLHPHHVYGRRTEWACCCVIPLCGDCHLEFVHKNEVKAREDGWLVRTRDKFSRDTME